MSQTTEAHAAYMRLWRKTNPDKIRTYRKRYANYRATESYLTDLNKAMQTFLCTKWPVTNPELI